MNRCSSLPKYQQQQQRGRRETKVSCGSPTTSQIWPSGWVTSCTDWWRGSRRSCTLMASQSAQQSGCPPTFATSSQVSLRRPPSWNSKTRLSIVKALALRLFYLLLPRDRSQRGKSQWLELLTKWEGPPTLKTSPQSNRQSPPRQLRPQPRQLVWRSGKRPKWKLLTSLTRQQPRLRRRKTKRTSHWILVLAPRSLRQGESSRSRERVSLGHGPMMVSSTMMVCRQRRDSSDPTSLTTDTNTPCRQVSTLSSSSSSINRLTNPTMSVSLTGAVMANLRGIRGCSRRFIEVKLGLARSVHLTGPQVIVGQRTTPTSVSSAS